MRLEDRHQRQAQTLPRPKGMLPIDSPATSWNLVGRDSEQGLANDCPNFQSRNENSVALNKPHRPQQTVIDNSISRQTVVTLVCPNGVLSSRADYAIDRAAVISSAGEPFLDANHD